MYTSSVAWSGMNGVPSASSVVTPLLSAAGLNFFFGSFFGVTVALTVETLSDAPSAMAMPATPTASARPRARTLRDLRITFPPCVANGADPGAGAATNPLVQSLVMLAARGALYIRLKPASQRGVPAFGLRETTGFALARAGTESA